MKDLLNYLKDSELWQSALDLGYEISKRKYINHYLNLNDGNQVCLSFIFWNGRPDSVRLTIEKLDGQFIDHHSMHNDVKRNENNIINYLKTLEG
tara:strand:+ start:204 stop:485 length:282 start_codon:yes stop_codon:yes gene_type:complete